ncbi:MAG: hypothetical protein ACYDIA_21065, partial [Candidatus Humimicrobiaceae bacterium]
NSRREFCWALRKSMIPLLCINGRNSISPMRSNVNVFMKRYTRCTNNPNIQNVFVFKEECEYSINSVCKRYITKRSQDLGLLSNRENYNVVDLSGWQEQINNLNTELIAGFVFDVGGKASHGLFSINLNGIAEPIETYCVIGSGFLFAEYVLSRLYKKEINIFEAINIAIYVIEEVKKNDPNCGGDTKISVISNTLGLMPKKLGEDLIKQKIPELKDIDKRITSVWKEFIINPAKQIKEWGNGQENKK